MPRPAGGGWGQGGGAKYGFGKSLFGCWERGCRGGIGEGTSLRKKGRQREGRNRGEWKPLEGKVSQLERKRAHFVPFRHSGLSGRGGKGGEGGLNRLWEGGGQDRWTTASRLGMGDRFFEKLFGPEKMKRKGIQVLQEGNDEP